jgi:hypothetical protein
MATKAETTAPTAGAPTELFALLGEDDQPLSDVLGVVSEAILARAWAAGDIEFGRASHCVTGRPGVPESNPTLMIEDGFDWTGPKTPRHKRFSGLLADSKRFPECRLYRRYVRQVLVGKDEQGVEKWRAARDGEDVDGQETRWGTKTIDRAEAESLLALRVRLTDKGLAGGN